MLEKTLKTPCPSCGDRCIEALFAARLRSYWLVVGCEVAGWLLVGCFFGLYLLI